MEISTSAFTTLAPRQGYVFAEWNKGHKFVELQDAVDERDRRFEWHGGEPVYLTLRFPNPMKFSKDAKNFLGSAEGRKGIKACAILVGNTVGFYAIKFALWVSREDFPITVVRSEEDAVEWFKENPEPVAFS